MPYTGWKQSRYKEIWDLTHEIKQNAVYVKKGEIKVTDLEKD